MLQMRVRVREHGQGLYQSQMEVKPAHWYNMGHHYCLADAL